MLERLRSSQVVLLTNVALRVWQGRVYGQSLNQRMSKNETTIQRLSGSKQLATGHSASSKLSSSLQHKVDRVEDWVSDFLYTTVYNPSTSKRINNIAEGKSCKSSLLEQSALPPDTQ
jgi:hypothetical protein